MGSTDQPVGGKEKLETLLARVPFSVQVFAADGHPLSQPSVMPGYCSTLSRTLSGSKVCNKGCGLLFPSTIPSDRLQLFLCPFGVSNACGVVDGQTDGIILVGGRIFRNYNHFRSFVEISLAAGASLDELVDNCASIQFHEFSDVEPALRDILIRLEENAHGMTEKTPQAEPLATTRTLEPAGAQGMPSHRVEFLRQFHANLRNTKSLAALGDVLLKEISIYARAQTVSFFLFDPEHDELVMTNAMGLPADAELGMRRPANEGILGFVFSNRRPLAGNAASSVPDVPRCRHKHYKSNCFASFPLCVDHQMFGVLNVTNRENDKSFCTEEMDWIGLLTHSAAIAVEQKTLSQQLEKAQYVSLVDRETHIGSRRLFNMRLREEFQRSARRNHSLCLVLVHVDPYTAEGAKDYPKDKKITQASLKTAAGGLSSSLRSFDMVMRYQDNTLAVLLPEATRAEAESILARLENAARETWSSRSADPTFSARPLRLTFGLAQFPADATTMADLKALAEQTLASRLAAQGMSAPDTEMHLQEVGDDPTGNPGDYAP